MRKQTVMSSNRGIPSQYLPGYVPSKGKRFVAYAEMILFAIAFIVLFTVIAQSNSVRF